MKGRTRLAYPLTIFSSSTLLARWPKPNSLKYLPGKHLEKRQSLGIGSGALCSTNWANTVSKLKGTRAKKCACGPGQNDFKWVK